MAAAGPGPAPDTGKRISFHTNGFDPAAAARLDRLTRTLLS
ncbi:hypothetical protein BCF44_107203 [Kutzneria buriramensis]|uniref:Uncharacterized protein n=1 Tax=Kutzneria buriramensis TaxID=1045776 RepID=A0A3E0HI89_9PSEU|nr:hypothetical protein BCF44_107203 [Kutzneria buriramensis]